MSGDKSRSSPGDEISPSFRHGLPEKVTRVRRRETSLPSARRAKRKMLPSLCQWDESIESSTLRGATHFHRAAFLQKGRSLPGPVVCGGPAGAFPPALADCLPLFRPHRFQPKGGALCTAGGQGTPVRSWRHQFCIVCVFRRNVKPGGLFSRSAAVSAYSPGWLCPGPDPLRSAPSSLPQRDTGSRWGSPSGCSWPAQWCLRRAAPALLP